MRPARHTVKHRPGRSTARPKGGQRILAFMRDRGMSWTVWCFHAAWAPSLLADWNYTPKRPAGEFFRGVLQQSP